MLKGVCCQYCIDFEADSCPVSCASPWSRWGNWCNKYKPNPKEKEAVTLEEAFMRKHKEQQGIISDIKNNT